MGKNKIVVTIISIIIVITVGVFGWLYYSNNQPQSVAPQAQVLQPTQNSPQACTEEAKVCPDGSMVSRTGPNCEFVKCPEDSVEYTDTSDWKTYRNEEYGFELEYDPDLKGGGELTLDNKVTFGYNSSIMLSLNIVQIETSFEELHSSYTQYNPDLNPIITNEIIGGKISKVFKFPQSTFVYIPLNETLKLEIFGETVESFSTIFNQIISAFKFIDADKNETSKFKSDEQGNFYGALVVTGYPIIKTVEEPFCNKNCATYDYVFFKILDTNNNAIFDFLGVNNGNSFVGDKEIGLGCVENNIISYSNDSNEFGGRGYNLSAELSGEILEASKSNPITIELERLLYTSGRGAPACYSHFTYVRDSE